MTESDANKFVPLKTHWFHIMLSLAGGEQHGYGIMQEVLNRTTGKGAVVASDAIWINQAADRGAT